MNDAPPVRLLAVNGKRKFAARSLVEGAMADRSSRRKLAAILSADAVGYSRLMAANEAATVETLKAYRDIIARLVARRGGRVVNAPGDALLAEFPSAVEAVQAAIEIQQSVEGHNIELEADRRMQFRIGVNLGDVIEEADGTIYGDGVNIAARMEALAEGGGVCISSTVYDAVEGKLALGFDFLGEHQVKNIAKPVRVYRVRAESKPPSARSRPKRRMQWQIAVPAVALILLLLGAAGAWRWSSPRFRRYLKKLRLQSYRSRTLAAIPSGTVLPMESPRTSLQTCRSPKTCLSSPGIRRKLTRANLRT